jgi:hypothetical protein
VSVEPSWMVMGAVILGGIVGLFQIPVWQGWATAGIVLGRVLMTWGQAPATSWADSLSALITFLVQGGLKADDPASLLSELRGLSSTLGDDEGGSSLGAALFGLPVILMYLVGRWRNRTSPTAWGPFSIYSLSRRRRLASTGLGAINGYLVARFLLPLLGSSPNAVVAVRSDEVIRLMDENWTVVVIGFVLIVIILGLQASDSTRGGSSG